MASKKDIILDRYAAGMFVRQEIYAQRVKKFYDLAVDRLLALASQHPDLTADKKFSFADNMRVGDETSRVIRSLYSQVYAEIKKDCEAEWEFANLSCDKMIQSIFGWKLKDRSLYARWFERNSEAVDKFFARTQDVGGLNLSQRVWKYTGQLRTEMEAAITVSLGEGASAAQMSREVRKYLKDPDKLFRRVKGSDGKLHLSENAKAFHTGRGVYRSSYKNAMRLTRTETNAAYRTADEDRWERMDFVIGFEVKKSAQHEVRMPKGDICDLLAGKYPKGFKFTGWHPHCLCYVVPILAKENDFIAMQKAILNGNDPRTVDMQAQEIKDVPDNFKKWIAANTDRINAAAVKPYFIAQNYVDGDISKGLVIQNKPKDVWQIAKERHASRDAAAIQQRWNERKMQQVQNAIKQSDIEISPALQTRIGSLQSAIQSGNTQNIALTFQRAMQGVQTQQKWDAIVWEGFTAEQKANLREFEKAVGVKKGRRMTHEQADTMRVNPHYKKKYVYDPNGKYLEKATGRKLSLNPKWDEKRDKPYTINCQTCAPVYELRRMGFNIEAKAFKGKDFEYLCHNYREAWKTQDGKLVTHWRSAKKASEIWNDVASGEDGVFQIECRWKGGKSGHTFNMVKEKGKIYFYDPQTNEVFNSLKEFEKYSKDVSPKYGYQYFRINNKLINVQRVSPLVKEAEDYVDPIERARQIRHANRDEAAIRQRLAERRARYALIEKTSKNVLNVAHDYPELQGEIKRLQALVDSQNYVKQQIAVKDLAKKIASINRDLAKLEDLIPDAKYWHSQFTIGDLRGAYQAIQVKLDAWKTLSLDEQVKKLEFEIKFVADPSKYKAGAKQYPTWKISQIAYTNKLQEVKDKIFWNKLDSEYVQIVGYKTKSSKFVDALAKYNDAVHTGNKLQAQTYLDEAKKIKQQLEQRAARTAAKKSAANAVMKVEQSVLNRTLTDDEYLDMSTRLQAKRMAEALGGKRKLTKTQQQLYVELKDAIDAKDVTKTRAIWTKLGENLDDVYSAARKDLALWHIDANEALDYFFNFTVEQWKTMSATEKHGIWNYTEGSAYCTETLRGIKGYRYYASRKAISTVEKDVEAITNALARSSVDQDVWIKRDEISAFMDYRFGINLDSFKGDPSKLVGMIGTDDSFVSCGSCKRTSFGYKPVCLNIYAPKGTRMMYCEPFSEYGQYKKSWDGVSKPTRLNENEVLLQRGTKFRIIKAEWNPSDSKWYIDLEIIEQDARTISKYENDGGWHAIFD